MLIRRRSWGADERAVARRARRLFGTPKPFQWLWTLGLNVRPINESIDGGRAVRGEWIEPERTDDEGVIFYIHGGGYVSCSAGTHRPITSALARLARRRVFSLDYRLAPEHRYPAALDDVIAAYDWLRTREGIPASAISFAGDSAGGGLVLASLLRLRDEGVALPACAVCFSPWTDLAGEGESHNFNDGRCAMFYAENNDDFARAYLGDASPRQHYASPAYADCAGLPPILLQVGSTELLLDDARRVHRKIQAAHEQSHLNHKSHLVIYEDVAHCWQMLNCFVPESRAAMLQAASFVRDPLSFKDDASKP
jgi:monoterpene epsilon-lactone hydrolase